MDQILRELAISIPKIYIYTGLGFLFLLSYIFGYILTYNKPEDIIKKYSLKTKVQDLESLVGKLCERNEYVEKEIDTIKEKHEIFSKQATFRLDMQSVEQKQIREIITNFKQVLEHLCCDSDEHSEKSE